MNEERTEVFLNSLDRGSTPYLEELYEDAVKRKIPVIRRPTQTFLRFLLALRRPEKILEIGTAIGFSALFMAEYCDTDVRIITIEKSEKLIPEARQHFREANMEDRITLLEGDAADILPELRESCDLIFMDAAKGQYSAFLPDALRLLKTGGLLLSDNVLMDGVVMESRFAVVRRNRTIHERMRSYLKEIKDHPLLVTDILPVGDGIAVSVKVSKDPETFGTEPEAR
ncbi:MAG: O-methyltransferase [Lachnospiraceae bacterium]|nr:O-methyltransferase [Lachnospiraceae bacterium]